MQYATPNRHSLTQPGRKSTAINTSPLSRLLYHHFILRSRIRHALLILPRVQIPYSTRHSTIQPFSRQLSTTTNYGLGNVENIQDTPGLALYSYVAGILGQLQKGVKRHMSKRACWQVYMLTSYFILFRTISGFVRLAGAVNL